MVQERETAASISSNALDLKLTLSRRGERIKEGGRGCGALGLF